MKEKLEKLPFYNQMVLPYHFAGAAAAGIKYKFPAKKMRVIGVTGTNGKTTTCFMIWKMLNEAGHKTGLLTTVAWGVDKLQKQIEHMTTVDSKTLNSRIEKVRETGAEFLVLEVTSHAMAQFRTLGIPVEIAVMTNVTHDHLDYHKTFERYRDAKRKLFKKAKYGVINADDKSAKYFKQDVKEYVTYGINGGEKRAKKIALAASGVEYVCDEMKIKTQIPGNFNVYNSLAAMCVGEKLGLSKEEIEKGIFALAEVEGRMNRVNEGQNFEVIVDYAHTPDALEKVFNSVNGHKGRIISVHGGAGRRDESTRPIRGEILGKNSDIVIVTEDDSRDEDPEKIAAAFVEGAKKAGKKMDKDLFVEIDRGKAIEMAIKMAKKGDLVLLLGKGHEKTILRKEGPVPFEDLKVARKVLKGLK
ncbi:UDP-N-acetylmuramoyl-L-alanyl-D-glutamate--2,6-diaminopimelate ligase [Candidatus Saccharibacteria bacterium]|nr:UDP-N-acetylmuramoyl-L-alanyl-D-glutamate--2,6-diaminopimelate ligase [Candidatus Saccharibacteria bacterium]